VRFIHTSDWHLGRTLHGESLLEDQRAFLTWLIELAVDRDVDAVLVAGDVYDRAIPSTDAVQLLDQVLVGMARARVQVLLTSGNHDSAIRLGFGGALQAAAGIHVRTQVVDIDRPVVLRDDGGELALYGIPYLLPDAVMDELGAERSHASVLAAAVERIKRDADSRGVQRVVVVGHAFITGAAACESERDIRVGGIGDAPPDVFDGLTYTALGHLHGPQRVRDTVRYSGSPLAFSFSERDHRKSVTLVDIAADGTVGVELVAIPAPRPLREVRGRLTDLIERADGDLRELADAWVKAVLTDRSRPLAPLERLREKWPHTIALDFQPEGALTDATTDLARVAEAADPVEICAAFVEWVDSTRPTSAQRDALQTAVEAVARMELSA
jgi:DNA repair protein SbcD/Mre11